MQKKDSQLRDVRIDDYILREIKKLELIYPAYIPKHIVKRVMKDKEVLFAQIKAKVS